MDGAQTHGTHPWSADFERRSILIKYASRTATRSGASQPVSPPEIYWDEEIVAGDDRGTTRGDVRAVFEYAIARDAPGGGR